ncbi:hypothetical protein [Ornithinibacillus halophilus]|uniref:DUF4367 domain-containing protein n=1 Tax=Ornithinibacillus halophilus TaxID=930117 RepID=A0A1M5EM98_9BACI|nr:hypothetical protein [Ornithinibacillus halophilus]SHF80221.1 hypothetical protein SAMN05216225_100578 [Ornithinibacillus halophilus]
MERKTIIVIAALTLFIIVFSVISYDTDDAVFQKTKEAAENAFETPVSVNYESEGFSFYLSDNATVEEVDANNVILTINEQLLLVFYNPFESSKSKLNYDKVQENDNVLLESFEDDEKFGYVRILPEEDAMYELQVGIGGVKITTISNRSNLEKNASEAMTIANSIISSEKQE